MREEYGENRPESHPYLFDEVNLAANMKRQVKAELNGLVCPAARIIPREIFTQHNLAHLVSSKIWDATASSCQG